MHPHTLKPKKGVLIKPPTFIDLIVVTIDFDIGFSTFEETKNAEDFRCCLVRTYWDASPRTYM